MLSYFPKYFSDRAIYLYVALLLIVSVAFGYPMAWYWWLFGLVEVAGFFYFSNQLSRQWSRYSSRYFEKRLFSTALWIRLVYVTFIFFFYKGMTGQPFEFGAADDLWYEDMARLGARIVWGEDIKWKVFFGDTDPTDLGYPVWLTIIYSLTGKSIYLARCVKAVLSAYTAVLMYRLARRNFSEEVGRMTGVFCMLMPNLIYYCGVHLKETEMLFLTVVFIEKVDYILHTGRGKVKDWLIALLALAATYFFRAALCAVMFLAFITAVILGNTRIKSGLRHCLEVLVVILLIGVVFGNVLSEQTQVGDFADAQAQQETNMNWRAEREGGNSYAVYAGAAVFAPLIFTLPFPTMVNIPYQQDQQLIHGGNYVKNITSFFTILALLILLSSGKWRDHVLPLAFVCGYLVVLVFSSYAQSERFHIPSLPFELMIAAYGITSLRKKHVTWFTYWMAFIFVANVGWAWFKLRGRGM